MSEPITAIEVMVMTEALDHAMRVDRAVSYDAGRILREAFERSIGASSATSATFVPEFVPASASAPAPASAAAVTVPAPMMTDGGSNPIEELLWEDDAEADADLLGYVAPEVLVGMMTLVASGASTSASASSSP